MNKLSPSPTFAISSDETLAFDYGVFFLFSAVILLGVLLYFMRKPLSQLLHSEIKVEFRELGMDDDDDVEFGPGIKLVQRSELDDKFVLDPDSDTEEETT